MHHHSGSISKSTGSGEIHRSQEKLCIPPVEIKEDEFKGMSKKISSITKPFHVSKIN